MSYASGTATTTGRTHANLMRSCRTEICEETGDQLFRAGDYAAPGKYLEIETRCRITLSVPDFLPARLDGKAACYRLVQCGRNETGEQALVQRQAQFHALTARTHKRLYHFVRQHTLGNSQDAEDLTQEALARAWTHFEAFNLQCSFDAWVFRIARNLLIDQSRYRGRRHEVSLDAPVADMNDSENLCCPEFADSTGDPQNCLMANEISDRLQFALRSLPSIHRKTLLLVAQQHSYEQIARAFDCSVGTVRSRICRARVLVRRNLKESTSHE